MKSMKSEKEEIPFSLKRLAEVSLAELQAHALLQKNGDTEGYVSVGSVSDLEYRGAIFDPRAEELQVPDGDSVLSTSASPSHDIPTIETTDEPLSPVSPNGGKWIAIVGDSTRKGVFNEGRIKRMCRELQQNTPQGDEVSSRSIGS